MEIYAEERARRTITSYYCVQDGLVILDAFGLTHREPTITSSDPECPERRLKGLSRGTSSHRTTTDTKETGNATAGASSPAAGAASTDPSSWLEGVLSRMLRRSDTESTNATPTSTSSTSNMDNGTHSPPSPDQTFDMLEEEEDEHDLVIQDDDGIDHASQIDDESAPGDDPSTLSHNPSPPLSNHDNSGSVCECSKSHYLVAHRTNSWKSPR